MRFFLALCAGVACVAAARAQTAQEVVDSANKTYRELASYQVQATHRAVRLYPVMQYMPGGPGGPNGYPQQPTASPRLVLSSGRYIQFSLKLRKPEEWSLSVQTQSTTVVRNTSPTPGKPTMTQEQVVTFDSLVRAGGAPPEFAGMQNGKLERKPLPASELLNQVRSMLVQKNAREVVVSMFSPQSGGFATARSLGVTNPELITDPSGGSGMHVVSGQTSSGDSILLWVDKANFTVTRAVIYSKESMPMPSMGGPRGGSEPTTRTSFAIHETLYRAQEINPAFQAGDFVLQTPQSIGPINPGDYEWLSQAILERLTDEKNTEKTSEAAGSSSPAASPAIVTTKVETQALSQEQMSGIVLIEGDGGTATGFMTKIKGVDFVVTNLHVLGGNKKLTLKTLGGAEIPIQGIFGAAGCDVAIIRVPAGQGELKLSEDVLKTSKIGDKVVVVGNRQGGGVATQISGSIVGIGPNRVEVSANFEPGNSGSPIVNLSTGEVVAVASYAETRRLDVDETSAMGAQGSAPQVEKRWFGYRLDGISKWESIDLRKWNEQSARIDAFRDMSESLVALLRLEFAKASRHPRLAPVIAKFRGNLGAASNNSLEAATAVKDLFYVIRTMADDGVRDLKNGDYYDYYRTSLYWETSIPAQLEYRDAILAALKKYEANSSAYLSRMRSGGGN